MRQRLGQHFLRDPKVVQTILAAAELKSSDSALEIGPGKGVLTFELARRVKHLTAIELDAALADRLREKLCPPAQTIVHADFLKIDLNSLFPAEEKPIKVLGNLPYSITSPIFEKLLPWPAWDTGVFLIQKEVADRIQSEPGSRTFGILTLAVQLFAQVETIARVKPGAFVPPPVVMSTVIRLRRKTVPELASADVPAFFDLAHGAFAHRRKTLANSLTFFAQAPKKDVEKWLCDHAIDPALRAERLGLHDYARLAGAWAIFRREINLT